MLARWLAARDYTVSLLTWDEGIPDGQVIDGVTLYSMCRANAGIPGIRMLHPRTTSLWRAMARANADIYYHNCAEHYTGLIAMWCARRRKKFVFSSAHDSQCDARLPALKKAYERYLYIKGLRLADRIIVQTEHQRHMMRAGFGLEATSLPMPCPGPSKRDYAPPTFSSHAPVLWVGRLSPQKRPHTLIEIARRAPEISFEVAGAANQSTEYARELRHLAAGVPNIRWLGTVSRDQMPAAYQRALCLCCTSENEGFPNTFLEAWSHGKPLVTSFDPDGLVQKLGLGKVTKSVDDFVRALRDLAKDPMEWTTYSENCRKHYEETNEPESAMRRFEEQFLSVSVASPR
jgi:glycosyltransferase involved in cell wall biosynthesis